MLMVDFPRFQVTGHIYAVIVLCYAVRKYQSMHLLLFGLIDAYNG
jgi:hypothetical protein